MKDCANILVQMEIQAESDYMKKELNSLQIKYKNLKKEVKQQTEKITFKILMGANVRDLVFKGV